MTYNDLIQSYFERTVALQWYWTIYIIVIGGILAFSSFRKDPELVIAIILSVLYVCFAYKNLGAIEVTLQERQAFHGAIKEYTPDGEDAETVKQLRDKLEPVLPLEEPTGTRYFHIFCDLLTLVFIWAKEWQRRKRAGQEAGGQST